MASKPIQTQFQYHPIGKDDIRLLTWSRAAFHEDDKSICLLMVTVPRSGAPEYTALSYEWTRHSASEPIYIDEQCFLVRPNLYSCLKRLREARGLWEYVWIDALCIDQGNVSERNDQVREMASTYRDASTVVAWLGNDTGLDSWHGPVEYTAAETEYFAKPMDEDEALKMQSPLSGSLAHVGLRPRRSCDLMQLCRGHVFHILDLSYWTRKWIVQELHLARSVDILWGRFSFTWEDIGQIVNKYTEQVPVEEGLYTSVPDAARRTWFVGKRQCARVFLDATYLRVSEYRGRSMSLAALLGIHWQSVCSDPRDRIFALLGILPQEERRLLSNFFPDYAMNHCLVALTISSYLKQTEWRDSDDNKTFKRLGYDTERAWVHDCAKLLNLKSNEVSRFFEISDACEERIFGGAAESMQRSPVVSLPHGAILLRPSFQREQDEVLQVLTQVVREYADYDWSEFPRTRPEEQDHANHDSEGA